jgi:hypothetical protein
MNPILGEVNPDPIGEMLGTGMMCFVSPVGISGLCKESEDGNELNLLAVVARQRGTGQFRTFIDQCKNNYNAVRVLDIMNEDLAKVLKRYGFVPCKWLDQNEVIYGMEWKKYER